MTCEAANHYYHVVLGLVVGLSTGLALASVLWCRFYAKSCRQWHEQTKTVINQFHGADAQKKDAQKAH